MYVVCSMASGQIRTYEMKEILKAQKNKSKESKMLLRSVKILLRILKEAIACRILPVGMFSFCLPCL